MAKGYLENSTKNIAEISNEVGYENALYFSRLFRKYTGMTPTEYRKKRGKGDWLVLCNFHFAFCFSEWHAIIINGDIQGFRLGDIQNFVLMICTPSAWFGTWVQVHTKTLKNIFFVRPSQKSRIFLIRLFFIQTAGLSSRFSVYLISPLDCISSLVRVYFSAVWWYTMLRIDDIPQQVADDIQCFALMI